MSFLNKFLFLVALMPTIALAKNRTYESTEFKTNLIELYSSEGCSSCPPAERWIAKFKNHKKLWIDFVPLEFNVDYWDYLGWLDKFSHKLFTNRQKKYAKELGLKTIYTSGVFLNGEELKQWSTYKPSGKGIKVGKIKAVQNENGIFKIEFKPEDKKLSHINVNIALLGNGLVTKVSSGENSGSTLKHEFVVLGLRTKTTKKTNQKFVANIALPQNNKIKAKTYSVAIWVNKNNKQTPIQAVGGPLK